MTLKTRQVAVKSLHEDPANARTHDDRNLGAIEASIREFGQVEPLVVQKKTGKVIGGNGRLRVLKKLGVKTVTVVEVDLNDIKATQLGIALNRSGELGAWDAKTLDKLLTQLEAGGVDVDTMLRFSEREIENLLHEQSPDADDTVTRLDVKQTATCPKCGHEFEL